MSDQPILYPSLARDTDIADEIAERAQDHVPQDYFELVQKLAEAPRAQALQDLVQSARQLVREFDVCHDVALAQLVRAHRASAAAHKLLLGGGLDKLLGLANAKNMTLEELFDHHVLGPARAKNAPSMITEPAINTLRNRMVNLSGSERAGVGLGAIAAVYHLSKAVLPLIMLLARNGQAATQGVRECASPYALALNDAVREAAQPTIGRRAVAFGATQAFQISDDLFAFLKARAAKLG